MDSIPSAPTVEENSSAKTPVRQVFLKKRKKDEEGEWENENDEATKETNEEKERYENEEKSNETRMRQVALKEINVEKEQDENEEKSNETRFGAKPKRKAEFKDVHAAMSPNNQQLRAPSPSNLASGSKSQQNQLQEHPNKTGKVANTKYK